MNRAECLDSARKCVLHDRNKEYGGPEDNFADIAAIRAVVSKCKHPLARVALEEIAVKMARLVHNPTHADSWIDICGYGACGAEVASKG
jgi:hypothetical protein